VKRYMVVITEGKRTVAVKPPKEFAEEVREGSIESLLFNDPSWTAGAVEPCGDRGRIVLTPKDDVAWEKRHFTIDYLTRLLASEDVEVDWRR
jgi:hypothetical protein